MLNNDAIEQITNYNINEACSLFISQMKEANPEFNENDINKDLIKDCIEFGYKYYRSEIMGGRF